jgi:transcriptional regulator with XRE-family HTH domain
MEINERIRVLREFRKLTLNDLSIKSGLSLSTIAKFESSKPPDIQRSSLIALAKALEIDGDYFLTTESKRTMEYYFKREKGYAIAVAINSIPDEKERKIIHIVVDAFCDRRMADAHNEEKKV